jgi:hypothetical protein
MPWEMCHQAARAIIERCSDVLLAAMSRKTPTGIKKLRNIGSTSFFRSKSQLECRRSIAAEDEKT